jgi:hypothetical protein
VYNEQQLYVFEIAFDSTTPIEEVDRLSFTS